MSSLAEALPREIARVSEIIPRYDALPKGAGIFGSMMLRNAVQRAIAAIGSGDVVEQIRVYEELKGCE